MKKALEGIRVIDLIHDPRFENNHLRTDKQPELSAILTAELIQKTTAERPSAISDL